MWCVRGLVGGCVTSRRERHLKAFGTSIIASCVVLTIELETVILV